MIEEKMFYNRAFFGRGQFRNCPAVKTHKDISGDNIMHVNISDIHERLKYKFVFQQAMREDEIKGIANFGMTICYFDEKRFQNHE